MCMTSGRQQLASAERTRSGSIRVVELVHLFPRCTMKYNPAVHTWPSSPGEFHPEDRVAGGGHPPPAPTERSVQFSRTTLFER